MEHTVEQRYAVKFCFKLGKSALETLELIKQPYKDDALSRTRVFEWHKMIKEVRELVDDEHRVGRPTSARTDVQVAKVKKVLDSDRRSTIALISEETGLSVETVHTIVTEDLAMRKVCAKLVPKILSEEQKLSRVEISQEILDCVRKDDHFLDNVITGDETWVYQYDPEAKRQSSEWRTQGSPRPKKARMSKSKIKIMLITFFDRRDIVYKEFVPTGMNVNAAFYVQVLTRLQNRVTRIRPAIARNWALHHDNAPCHGAIVVQQLLTKFDVATLPHPPYSPDLAPPDFFLFPRIKRELKGHRFDSIEAIQAGTTKALNSIPETDFQKAFDEWQRRQTKYVDAGGMYFENY
nr:PREDICTED: putative uncharacterized protein FLJ37770 [Megachile rotundata]